MRVTLPDKHLAHLACVLKTRESGVVLPDQSANQSITDDWGVKKHRNISSSET